MPFLESSLRSHFMSLQRTVKAAKKSSRVLGEVGVGVKVRLYKEPTEWDLLQGPSSHQAVAASTAPEDSNQIHLFKKQFIEHLLSVGLPWWPRWSSEKVKVAQSCLTLCNPMDYRVHGILQGRILEWVA